MSGIAERLAAVRERIHRACEVAGRDPASVELLAVSKTRTRAEILEAYGAGQRAFGENKVQEAGAKVREGLPGDLRLHLVGHLQGNKAAQASKLFSVIHSVDSLALLSRLDAGAVVPIEALVQVDLAGEPTKHGALESALEQILAGSENFKHVRVRGLMCLPPYSADPEATRPWFRRLREMRDRLGGREKLPCLSMGMSHDFEVAIAEGATIVRIGEAVFGPRMPPGGG